MGKGRRDAVAAVGAVIVIAATFGACAIIYFSADPGAAATLVQGYGAPIGLALTVLLTLGGWWWHGRPDRDQHSLSRILTGPPATVAETKPAITDRWRASNGQIAPELLRLGESLRIDHPGYAARERALRDVSPAQPPRPEPATIRIAVSIGCGPLDADEPATSQLHEQFTTLLNAGPLRSIVASFTSPAPDMIWTSRAGRGRRALEAVLTGQDSADHEDGTLAPIAWSRLTFPQPEEIGRLDDALAVQLVLVLEPRNPDGQPATAALETWPTLFANALQLPGLLACWLDAHLHMMTTEDPKTQCGIWLERPAELVDVTGFQSRAGAQTRSWHIGCASAAADGRPADAIAQQLTRDLCDITFNLHGYERIFGAPPAMASSAPGTDSAASLALTHNPTSRTSVTARQLEPSSNVKRGRPLGLKWALGMGMVALFSAGLIWRPWQSSDEGYKPQASSRLGTPILAPTVPSSAREIKFYNNWGKTTDGHAMCTNNTARPESIDLGKVKGKVTQTFVAPKDAWAISSATIQIDQQVATIVTAELALPNHRSVTAKAFAANDTSFVFPRTMVTPGDTITLSLTFSSAAEAPSKLVTIYTAGEPGGTFAAINNCPDGAENVGPTTATGLRAIIKGDDNGRSSH
jgi:hypothetical protein